MGSTRQLDQTDPVMGSMQEAIPGVDAASLATGGASREEAIQSLRRACLETGFFCVDNFLGKSAEYAAVLRQMERFFALADSDPVKQAINVANDNNTNGWMPLFHEPAYQPGTIAHLESFDCGRPAGKSHDPSQRPNRWPDVEGFRTDVEALWQQFSALGRDVLCGLAEAFALDREFLHARCRSQELNTMRLLNYPEVDLQVATESDVGIAAHTDFECITFIVQTAPGLELMNVNGDWYDAPAGPDRIVVLLGDMLERWTNGTLRATGHRVRKTAFQRFSIVLFFAVDDEVTVAPLAPFVTADNPVRYSGVTQREHTRKELLRAETLRDAFLRRAES